jgi:predicted phosphoribosyltransferase
VKYAQIYEIEELRNRIGVFADRYQAGQVLAGLLGQLDLQSPLVLAIPAGGVPVAVPLAEALSCQLDVAVVSKITLPWNSEAGYGAVAFDGSCLLNEAMIKAVGLSESEVSRGIEKTRAKVLRRVAVLRKEAAVIEMTTRQVLVVDDGLASGFTMQAAVDALRRAGAKSIVVAVPTGHESSIQLLAKTADNVCCANVRTGSSFAVAAAYQQWGDVSEAEALHALQEYRRKQCLL